ncbi:hypothetical protein GCK72_025748 [Caenorhabditis remanei]|uniref:Uncharacterized protein n=1 Tax=Caenorhabditis remanei TaxID=31234 RepID=A0A6A5G3I4_CAERE|nr:hypothetical protein GCK72_025748 [Caenorhabditis remanei]KAF1749281.1 hypothetical protein GCK72_025748 [Caenorhabditis remanei]
MTLISPPPPPIRRSSLVKPVEYFYLTIEQRLTLKKARVVLNAVVDSMKKNPSMDLKAERIIKKARDIHALVNTILESDHHMFFKIKEQEFKDGLQSLRDDMKKAFF